MKHKFMKGILSLTVALSLLSVSACTTVGDHDPTIDTNDPIVTPGNPDDETPSGGYENPDDDTPSGDNEKPDNDSPSGDNENPGDDTPEPEPQGQLTFTANADETACTVTGIGTWTGSELTIPAVYEGLPVTAIGERAFFEQEITAVTLPERLTEIGDLAFAHCYDLTAIVIPEGVARIGYQAFRNCDRLTDVTLPSTLTEIQPDAFHCANIQNVYIADLAAWCNIQFGEAYANPLLDAEQLYIDGEQVTDLVIPDGVTEIPYVAFRGFAAITSVTLPDSVQKIGYQAFYGCENLTSVMIGNGVQEIDNMAFYICRRLSDLTLGNSIQTIGADAFLENGITTLVFPESLQTIGGGAFMNCNDLTSVTLQNGIKTIEAGAFKSCEKLQQVVIPESVTTVGHDAFTGCSALTSLRFARTDNWLEGTCPVDVSDPAYNAERMKIDHGTFTRAV